MDKPKVINYSSVDEMPNFKSLACVCGLTFPESATEFQKSLLTMAHMAAALRESVLRGSVIPSELLADFMSLAGIMFNNSDKQV